MQYLINFNSFLKNMFIGICIYIYELFISYDIPVMLYKIEINAFYILPSVFLVFFIIIFLYKNIITKKILLFVLCWFLFFLSPTFLLLNDYVFFNHRIILSMLSFIIIFVIFVEYFIKKYFILKKYLLILFVFLFFTNLYYSFIQQNKYKNKYEYWINTYMDAPNYHGSFYGVARLYIEQRNYNKAKEFLVKANEYGNNRYFSDLALIYYFEGDMNKAEEFYNKSIKLGINKAQCYRNLSVIYYKRDCDFNKAIKYANLAVQQEPYNYEYKQHLQKLKNLTNEENNI